jgi:putative ATP-dependent endonuclease of OLD family
VPITEIRIVNYRAYADSGVLKLGSITPIVGKNDTGKSGILHALQLFFEPPQRGGINKFELHGGNEGNTAMIEVAFDPKALATTLVKIDAKNKIDIIEDRLIDSKGYLRLRLLVSSRKVEGHQILINDIDYESFYPLALKNHDQLIDMLSSVGLPAKKAGKETNQEKRNSLREFATSKGAKVKEEWVDAEDVIKPMRDIFPNFIFFPDTPKYAISETSVQNQFKGIVDRALAGQPNAKQIEDDIKATIQAEFDKLHERLVRLTDTVTSISATPKVNWKKAIDGIGLSWGDTAGIELPYEFRGAGIRRLFMVAYFQYEVAGSMHDPTGPRYIFVIEEPEVHLHPGAQRDLQEALQDLGDLGHCVVFTTHSPVFAATASIENLILVSRNGAVGEAKQSPDIDIMNVAHELGVEASDRLIGRNFVILVEGSSDVNFYETILKLLSENGRTGLNHNEVLFLQCGGIQNLLFTATVESIDKAGLSWAIIADSDKMSETDPYEQYIQNLIENPPSSCRIIKILDRTSIENYLDPTAVKQVTGIECIIPKYGKPTLLSGSPLSKSNSRLIKNSTADIARTMGVESIVKCSDKNGQCEWVTIFDEIKDAFGL